MLSISMRRKAQKLALLELQREHSTGEALVAAAMAVAPPPHDVILVALAGDLAALKEIHSVEDKVRLKAEHLLPKYLHHVNDYIESGARVTNPLLVHCAIWCIDVGDLENGMRLAEVAVAQQQLAPEGFNRDLPTFLAESITDWAERQLKAGQSGSPYIDRVLDHIYNNTWPVTNPIVRGKAFKVAGQLAEMHGEPKEALALFEQAQVENEAAGCKGRIDKLKKQLGL